MRLGNRKRIRHAAKAPVAIRRPLGMGRRLVVERLESRALLAVLFEHGPTDAVRVLVPTEEDYSDLGFDWTGVAEPFDHSSWSEVSGTPNGVGFDRGSGAYAPAIGLDVEASMYEQSTTLFARAALDVPDASTVGSLTLSLRYDDGFIAWLNGHEVARTNTTGVYPAWDARADSEFEAPLTPVEFDVSDHVSFLHDGTNVLAIRLLNDSPAGDDALLQFTLVGESREGSPLAVDDAAETLEGQAVTIDVLANDREGSDPIDPATVAIATPPAHGTAVANPDGTITYTPNATYNGADSFTYSVRDNSGVGQPTSETLVATDAAVRAMVPRNDSLGTTWRGANEPFNDSGWQSGTFGVGYDANTATFDFTPYLGLYVSGMQNTNTTVYMRSAFSVDDPANVMSLSFRMRYDDGFVAFINGVEIARAHAPSSLTYNSRTSGNSRPDDQAVIFDTFDATPFISALRSGANILAIHGLNQTLDSSDMLMQPELTAVVDPRGRLSNSATVTVNVAGVDYPPVASEDVYFIDEGETLDVSAAAGGGPTTISIIDSGANWRYRDTGQLPANDSLGRTWKQQGYDDAAWASGPAQLGYGDGDEATVISFGPDSGNKYITSWFRRPFTLDASEASGATALLVELQRDDGGAVYINGVEVVRDGLPGVLGDDTLSPDTLAATTVDETTFFPFTVDLSLPRYANLLSAGDNVVAVEIHQSDRGSSDVSFDLRLSATIELVAGVLANDTEPDGQTMTAVLQTPPGNGTLDLHPDGTFSYAPNAGFVGVDTFTYHASDGVQFSSPTTVTISVRHRAPSAAPDSFVTDEDVPLVVDAMDGVLANDSDSQGHALVASIVSDPSDGTLSLNADGSFVYTPFRDFNGVDSFVYVATDGILDSRPVNVMIVVRAVNDPPSGVDDTYLTPQDTALNVVLAQSDAAGTLTMADFDTLVTPGILVQSLSAPGPQIYASPQSNFLRLTEAVGGQSNYVAFDRSAAGRYSRITVDFDFRIAPGAPAPGDGMGFVLLNTSLFGVSGPAGQITAEEPNVQGSLGVGFDIYDNFVETHNHLSLHSNGTRVGRYDFSEALLNLDDGVLHHARLEFVFAKDGVRVTARLTTTGGTVLVPIDGVLVPDVAAYESRLAFAGRTGQYTASHDIDNVVGEFRGPLDLGPAGALSNDVDVDIVSSALSAFVIDPPRFGALQFNTDGRFSYQPNTGYTGVDQFTYRVTDGQLFSDPTSVRIVVSPPGKVPEDLNADGRVDTGDVAFLLASFGKASNAKAIEGDLDGDGRIGMRDAIALRNAFTPSPAPAAAVVAKATDRAMVQVPEELNALHAARRERRLSDGMIRATLAETDQALATAANDLGLLASRRARILGRRKG